LHSFVATKRSYMIVDSCCRRACCIYVVRAWIWTNCSVLVCTFQTVSNDRPCQR